MNHLLHSVHMVIIHLALEYLLLEILELDVGEQSITVTITNTKYAFKRL